MIEISKDSNPNYLAKIFAIERIEKHSNADRLQIVYVDFQPIVTGMDAKEGDFYVYFPSESKLNYNFLSVTNSFRDSSLNVNKELKGFFEKNCRTKTMKLRGENSCGYIVPLKVIEGFTNTSGLDKFEGKYFDVINGIKMLEKYVVVTKESNSANKVKSGKVSKESLIAENQFKFHEDTSNLRREIFKVSVSDYIICSYKIHGTSAIFSKVLLNNQLNFAERMIKKITEKIPRFSKILPKIVLNSHGFVVSSRRVIKAVEDVEINGDHFYDENIWEIVGNEIKDRIPEGFSIYGEIVGYTPNNSKIQGDYVYGCKVGEHKLFVYKITFTNTEGLHFVLSTKDCLEFCKLYGFEFVPVLYQGFAKDLFPEIDESNHWHENFLKALENKYTEKECYFNKGLPEEGIVLRIENNFMDFEAYKLKSFKFLEKESSENDKGVANIEDEN